MQQLAKLAALKATKKFAEKESQLERLRFESQQKAKELQLEKDMAIAQTELAVYEQCLSSDPPVWSSAPALVSSKQSMSNSQLLSYPTTVTCVSHPCISPLAADFMSDQHTRPVLSVVWDSQQSEATNPN